jgi:single stranded DNA-binding protein
MRNAIYLKGVKQHMKSVNKVILLGNLTRDPELKHTENKKPVCSFGLVTNRNWTSEELVMLDEMPEDVKESLKDEETSERAQVQRV